MEKYKKLTELGKGAHGVVWKAEYIDFVDPSASQVMAPAASPSKPAAMEVDHTSDAAAAAAGSGDGVWI